MGLFYRKWMKREKYFLCRGPFPDFPRRGPPQGNQVSAGGRWEGLCPDQGRPRRSRNPFRFLSSIFSVAGRTLAAIFI